MQHITRPSNNGEFGRLSKPRIVPCCRLTRIEVKVTYNKMIVYGRKLVEDLEAVRNSIQIDTYDCCDKDATLSFFSHLNIHYADRTNALDGTRTHYGYIDMSTGAEAPNKPHD